jgi:hypothetical protein
MRSMYNLNSNYLLFKYRTKRCFVIYEKCSKCGRNISFEFMWKKLFVLYYFSKEYNYICKSCVNNKKEADDYFLNIIQKNIDDDLEKYGTLICNKVFHCN